MRRLLLIALVVAAGGTAAWLTGAVGDERGEDAVALVGGEPVTAEQYRREYVDYLLQSGLQDELRLRHSFLNRMIDVRILTLYARDSLDLENDPAVALEMERARRKLLIEGYLREAVYDTLTISEQDLEEMFVRVNTQLSASHLYARTRVEAMELKRRLDAGEPFDELAREVFADPELARNGGSIGYFGFDEMDPRFEEAANTLEIGEVSDPVQTSTGYSIIRLDDRRVRPLLTEYEFATRRDRIETYVRYRKRIQARESVQEEILGAARPVFDDRLVDYFSASAFGAGPDPSSALANEDLSGSAVQLADGSLSVAQVLEEARFMSDKQRRAARDRDGAREVLRGLVVRLELLDRAQAEGIASTDDYRRALESARRSQLYEGAWNRFRATTPVAEDSLRRYFEDHAEDFVVPERVRVREIVLESNEKAADLMRTLSPSNFAAAAAVHSIRPGADRSGGDLGPVTRDQMGMLAGRVFDAAPGAIVGPMEALGRYAIFLVGEREPARPATFDEARSEIEALLISDAVRAAVEGRIADVRRHYDIERFPDRAESIDLRTRVST